MNLLSSFKKKSGCNKIICIIAELCVQWKKALIEVLGVRPLCRIETWAYLAINIMNTQQLGVLGKEVNKMGQPTRQGSPRQREPRSQSCSTCVVSWLDTVVMPTHAFPFYPELERVITLSLFGMHLEDDKHQTRSLCNLAFPDVFAFGQQAGPALSP